VIMAGGKGTRLDPFTRILPKPLIPIGDKSIIEIIIDKFLKYQINHFIVSVNEKSKIIKSYFEELNPPYSISYIHEPKPLGTAGSLKYLDKKDCHSIIVTNCDIIIDADYADLVDSHLKDNNDITLVASMKQYKIPYGVCEIENGGALKTIIEKPEYNFLVNTGMYIIKTESLKLVPFEEYFHMTHLIEKVKAAGGKIGVYPISESSWIDTGEWEEYKNALKAFNLT
jgi:NDP-sugar pyrophosphorylase family protein